MIEKSRNQVVALGLFALSLSIFTLNARAHLRGQQGDTLPAQLMPITLLERGDLDFDEFFPPGSRPEQFLRVNGRLVSGYPILPGLLNVPVFAIVRAAGHPLSIDNAPLLSLWTGALLTAASVPAIFFLLLRTGISVVPATLLSLLFALGTTAFSVASRGIWQHGPALLFLSAGLAVLLPSPGRRPVSAGLLLGLAFLSRPPSMLLILPFLLLSMSTSRGTFLRVCAGFGLPVLAMRFYAAAYFGSPLAFAEYPLPATVSFVGAHPLEGLAGVLIAPGRGLFVYSPFLLFSLAGSLRAVRGRDVTGATFLVGATAYVTLVGAWQSWWGGQSFGYRMLTEALPALLCLSAAPMVGWWRARGIRRMAVLLTAAASLFANYVGARYYPSLEYQGFQQERVRAWSLLDNELVACTQALLTRLHARAGGALDDPDTN